MAFTTRQRAVLLARSATLALAVVATSTPAHAIIPNENRTPAEIVDTEDRFRGVGLIVTNVPGSNTIGSCTGTLINPRTVLFAAHCVNTRPDTDYNGTAVRAAVSFNVNALPGLQSWFANSQSNPALGVYNVNRIFYDPRSLINPAALGFIEADIAIASLDRPAVGIPTWALLFSTLPAPAAIDPVRGTNYHVNIVGYGRTGNATQGAITASDFRRRAAENLLGGFLSPDDRNAFLFGPAAPSLPQNLYQIDFDSQRRQAQFDINVHRDNALPNEGTTGPGDSGGPLILGRANNRLANEDLVIGVLSGGSRFFGAQPFSALGTTSFYQPLSLYWQYITATNPYRYVGTVAGNGNWEDPSRWVTLLDPVYRVINASGQVVNGLPTTPEQGRAGTTGDFGGVCVEFENALDECIDVRTGVVTRTGPPPPPPRPADGTEVVTEIGTFRGSFSADLLTGGETTALPGDAALPALAEAEAATPADAALAPAAAPTAVLPGELIVENAAQNTVPGLPAPSLANGLPGATGFIANNVAPVVSANPALNVTPRFFDVTLSQAGTTTLSSAVTIDRLQLRGPAGLTIATSGNLTSLIDVSQFGTSTTTVNGRLTSAGDYTLFGGTLEGTGTIAAPFLTSVAGTISPGTAGTAGTLTINGNLVLASGTTVLADITGTGAADRITVNGSANLGGRVAIGGLERQVNGQGRVFTILSATGGITGAFTPTAISPILSQVFAVQNNALTMEVRAASYRTVINAADPQQLAYAQLFDQNRPNAALSSLYGLDFASVGAIRDTFSALAPVSEAAVPAVVGQMVNNLQGFYDARLREASRDRSGGRIAVIGAPAHTALAALNPQGQPLGDGLLGLEAQGGASEATAGTIREDVGIYVAAGRITGDVAALPGFERETEVEGFYLAGGIEVYPGENSLVGVSGWFSAMDAATPLTQRLESDVFAATVYARHELPTGPVLDAQLSIGSLGVGTRREVLFLGQAQFLTSSTSDHLLVSGALGVSYDLETRFGTFSPGIEGRYASVDLGPVAEQGGTLALAFQRTRFESTQARAGVDYERQAKGLQLNAAVQMVHEFEDGPQLVAANFVSGIGPNANFLVNTADTNWAEISLSAQFGEGPLTFGLGFDSTIGRANADTRMLRASGTFRF